MIPTIKQLPETVTPNEEEIKETIQILETMVDIHYHNHTTHDPDAMFVDGDTSLECRFVETYNGYAPDGYSKKNIYDIIELIKDYKNKQLLAYSFSHDTPRLDWVSVQHYLFGHLTNENVQDILLQQ